MSKIESLSPYFEPIRKTVTVNRTIEDAFQIFTHEIANWWPKNRYSVSLDRTSSVELEPRAGGKVYEVRDDGQTFPWGEVLIWEPPRRLVLKWHPGRTPAEAQEVEVCFSDQAGGTNVNLEHRNWQGLGSEAAIVRERYNDGWDEVLHHCYVMFCNDSNNDQFQRNES